MINHNFLRSPESGASFIGDEQSTSRTSQDKPVEENWRQEEILSILECPVCLEIMLRCRIFQCRNGHNVCQKCSANPALSVCPQCREPYRCCHPLTPSG